MPEITPQMARQSSASSFVQFHADRAKRNKKTSKLLSVMAAKRYTRTDFLNEQHKQSTSLHMMHSERLEKHELALKERAKKILRDQLQ